MERRKKETKYTTISYKTREEQIEYKPENTLEFLLDTEIPSIKDHRSQYLHIALVLVEDFFNGLEVDIDWISTVDEVSKAKGEKINHDIPIMGELAKKLSLYAMSKRNELSKNHRLLLWCVRTRLDLIFSKFTIFGKKKKSFGSFETLGDIHSMGLLETKANVIDYSMTTLWNTLTRLIKKFNSLVYQDQISYFINCLYLCTSKFLCITSKNPSAFNNPIFCKKMDNGDYCITMDFMAETERIFYGLQRRLAIHESFKDTCIVEELSYSSKVNLKNWICSGVIENSSYVEFIMKQLNTMIYGWNVLIGEEERYKTDEKFGDATGYNIIAKYRGNDLDKIINIMSQENCIENMISRLYPSESEIRSKGSNYKKTRDSKGDAKRKTIVDIECSLISIIVSNFKFDGVLNSEYRFADQFVILRDKLSYPIDQSIYNRSFPTIIQTFNEFNVIHYGKLYICNEFASCFAMWIKLACEDPKIEGLLPGGISDLSDAYAAIFPDNTTQIDVLRKKHKILPPLKPDLLFPVHYRSVTPIVKPDSILPLHLRSVILDEDEHKKRLEFGSISKWQ
jgi:hypothetical protein